MLRQIIIGIAAMFAAGAAPADEFRPTGVYVRGETAHGTSGRIDAGRQPGHVRRTGSTTRAGAKIRKDAPAVGQCARDRLFRARPRATRRYNRRNAARFAEVAMARADGLQRRPSSRATTRKARSTCASIAEKKDASRHFLRRVGVRGLGTPVTAQGSSACCVNESDEGAINSLGTYMQWLNNPEPRDLGPSLSPATWTEFRDRYRGGHALRPRAGRLPAAQSAGPCVSPVAPRKGLVAAGRRDSTTSPGRSLPQATRSLRSAWWPK